MRFDLMTGRTLLTTLLTTLLLVLSFLPSGSPITPAHAAPAPPQHPDSAPELQAVVNVSGTIDTNTTWTSDNIYVVEPFGVSVSTNRVLTIEPGTVVKFESGQDLRVRGTLVAEGTAEQPIIFTSIRDDSVGGDTNGDGGATSPNPGDWEGIDFISSGVGRFQHVRIGYAGDGGEALYSNADSLFLDNVTIHDSSSQGLTVENNVRSLTVQNSRFERNSGDAAGINVSSLQDFTLATNTCVDNGFNGIGIAGSFNTSFVLDDPGCVLFVFGRATINATLTLAPGTVFKLNEGDDILVNGTLIAEGTAEEPIIFTSLRDDTVVGDTNSDGDITSPAPGDWQNISFTSGSVGRLQHVLLRYGGDGGDMLSSRGNSLLLDNVTIRNSSSLGLDVTSSLGELSIQTSRFESNLGAAARISMSGLQNFTFKDNTCVGNGLNGVGLSGSVNTAVTLDSTGCIFFVFTTVEFVPIQLDINATLTLVPGTVFKLSEDDVITVEGRLIAEGTADEPIIFTSLRDDTVGGDTNSDGDTTAPAPGNWSRFNFRPGSVGRFQHVQMSYGGDGGEMLFSFGDNNNIVLDNVTIRDSSTDGFASSGTPSVRITNSTFRANTSDGLQIDSVDPGGDVVIQNSRFETSGARGMNIQGGRVTVSCVEVTNNEGDGILLDSGAVTLLRSSITNNEGLGLNWESSFDEFDARNLWWGNASGPGGAGPGTGDEVSENVLVAPWREAAPDCAGNVDIQQPYVEINYPTGLPNSFLTVRGYNFPISGTVDIQLNEEMLDTVTTNISGTFELVFSTADADPGLYTVEAIASTSATTRTLTSNPPVLEQEEVRASVQFNLMPDALERPREAPADVPTIDVPSGLVRSGNTLYLPLIVR